MRSTRSCLFTLAFACVASPVAAQQDASLAGVRTVYNAVKGFVTQAAERMPEEHYSFAPTPEVRNFGQLIGHIANANYLFCAPVLGEPNGGRGNAEELTTKGELVEAVKASFAYCDRAYAIPAAQAGDALQFFGQQHTKLSVLAFNMGHDYEHYGNIVTYMRMKGLVPPSSQPAGGN